MTEQNPDETGVWPPPAGDPSWFTPTRRVPRADARVWPPAPPEEPPGSSTVPIPVIGRRPLYQGPPVQPPQRPVQPPPEPVRDAPDPSEAPAASRSAPAGPRSRRRRRPMRRATKIGLQLSGALVLAAAYLAVQVHDELSTYREQYPVASVRYVPQGQSAPLGDATWRLISVKPAPAGSQTPETPGRDMVQIELESTGLTADAKYYTTTLPGFYMADKTGRLWLALAAKTPEELGKGVTGRFTLVSAVPTALEDQVELVLYPTERAGKGEFGPSLRFAR
ncbi:hypothetical protein Skr01_73800 [Sphaerisporangium krabiense]|uniref:DUF4352 domain-containing protein n=1 Tax=Sphaerisporangium krabiense TaxID=763782 RepID=A0A7W8Z0F7_9ACTN|nr:hypothetical protein [Sphaerisporangium krabiense]MBB5625106.1 hypothetical protein [Sphaerisporangium krabiense]GII67295.1 hypothetical protein Skr01_73800 [Sphaerisporangium krabiense]